MGKNKNKKKTKRGGNARTAEAQQAKVARRVDEWVTDAELSERELMLAGIGVMARAIERGQRKLFKKALRKGRRLVDHGIPAIESEAPEPSDPVISYEETGGGWFSIAVDGLEVDRVQGEEAAAARSGSLLEAFAALDTDVQAERSTGATHAGGGWYDVTVHGVPVARVRGHAAAEEWLSKVGADSAI